MIFEQNGLLIDRHYIKTGSTIGNTELYLKMQPINTLNAELIKFYSDNNDYIYYLKDDGTLTAFDKDFSGCVNNGNIPLGINDVYISFDGDLKAKGPVSLTTHGDIKYAEYNGRKVWDIDNHQYITTDLDSRKYKTLVCVARVTQTDNWKTIWRNDNFQIGTVGGRYGIYASHGSPSYQYKFKKETISVDDKYHVYVFTIAKNQEVKYFIDGNKIIDKSTNNWWDKYTGNLVIGRWEGSSQDWHGQIYNMFFLEDTISEERAKSFTKDSSPLGIKPEYKNRLFFRKTPKVSFITSKSFIVNPVSKEFPITGFSDDGTEIQIEDNNPKIDLFDKIVKYKNKEVEIIEKDNDKYKLDGSIKLNNSYTDIAFDSYHRTDYDSKNKFTTVIKLPHTIYSYIKDDNAIEVDDDINGASIFIHNNIYRVTKTEKLDNGHYKAYLKFRFALIRIAFEEHFKPMQYKKSELVDPINLVYKYTYRMNIPKFTEHKYLFRKMETDNAVVLPPFTTYIGK